MKTVAFYTLGCKVNQYDSQAMLELFEQAGYTHRAFHEKADVYVVNTCVVTGTGEKKSLQAVRRALKQNPGAQVVLCGCLAQKEAEGLLSMGVRLVLGNANRQQVVTLREEAVLTDTRIAAVEQVRQAVFEPLAITGNEGHTRAVMKIQEGCDRFCAYCIIPHVRGGIRSRPVADIAQEALRLGRAGYREVVLTGIHLSSYGRDLQGDTLLDAIRVVASAPGVARVRLGSLEPVIATADFARQLAAIPQVCPQFHLSLQSGSDPVLKRMRRRYSAEQFLAAAGHLRRAFPGCALTTDLIAGFPGETQEEHQQTLRFVREIGFSRLHVFPFSPREGTPAATMPGQLARAVRNARAKELIALGEELAQAYRRTLLGTTQPVLFEEVQGQGATGYTPQYIQVWAQGAQPGELKQVHLDRQAGDQFIATI